MQLTPSLLLRSPVLILLSQYPLKIYKDFAAPLQDFTSFCLINYPQPKNDCSTYLEIYGNQATKCSFPYDMFFQYVQMRGSLEIIQFLLSCKRKWKANYGCVSTCLLRFCSTELICHPQSYWQLALSLSHFTYQMEMVRNLISLKGHLGWRPHLCGSHIVHWKN